VSHGVFETHGCPRCAALAARFRDPATPNPGAYLQSWAAHHLDDHGSRPAPRPGCEECGRFAAGPASVDPVVWDRWARIHFMACSLAPDWKWERGQR
jgi:hypothetical protein